MKACEATAAVCIAALVQPLLPEVQKMDTFVTGVSSQRGTLPWTAPEILRTPEAVTEKVDVFRWGPELHGGQAEGGRRSCKGG